MAEWLKAHAWKACIPQGIQGSNPCLSAIHLLPVRSNLLLNQKKSVNADYDSDTIDAVFLTGVVSGDDFSGVVTQKEYENDHLHAELKWGEKT